MLLRIESALAALWILALSAAFLAPVDLHTSTTPRWALKPKSSEPSRAEPLAAEWVGWDETKIPEFLSKFWQKRPLLVRQAFPSASDIAALSGPELAELSQADDVESRIIRHEAKKGAEDGWCLESGPFSAEDFASAAAAAGSQTEWTLLVNEVNRHVPEASDLLQRFAFLPSWRIDDLMVSHAPEGGGIGPHVDSYDVFLIQVGGRRRWSIEERAVDVKQEHERLVPGLDVRILREFRETRSWVLEPGDMLYIPPRVPHNGVSESDDCVTYSVGFRAPSHRELVTFFSDAVATQRIAADDRYRDIFSKPVSNPGLIDENAIETFRAVVRDNLLEALNDDTYFQNFLGKLLTTSKRDHGDYPLAADAQDLSVGYRTAAQVLDAVVKSSATDGGPFVYRAEGLCFAYVMNGDAATLFVDGRAFPLPARISFAAALLCAEPRLPPRQLGPLLSGENGPELRHLLEELLNAGLLYPADD